jgi:hypothetical protein
MLSEALAARIPLIVVRTIDPISVGIIVQFHTGKTPRVLKKAETGDVPAGTVYVAMDKLPSRIDPSQIYVEMVNSGCSTVVVNPPKAIPMSFDAGVLDTPVEVLVGELVHRVGVPEECALMLVESLEGLTPLEARWLVALVQSGGEKLTPTSLRRARILQSPPTRGLCPVSTEYPFYVPDRSLVRWLTESSDFLDHPDLRLRPRGLLFRGIPGTGKTMGSKFIARTLGLPLYRLEIGSVKSKYVGESDRLLREALAAADRHAPIVLLIDEVEKVLAHGKNGDSGTSDGLLGQLLWWLQEHTSPVLTLMTTNAIEKLPGELYRPGRIDEVLDVPPLAGQEDIMGFLTQCFETFGVVDNDRLVKHAFDMLDFPKDGWVVTHAEATKQVVDFVKKGILEEQKRKKGKRKK